MKKKIFSTAWRYLAFPILVVVSIAFINHLYYVVVLQKQMLLRKAADYQNYLKNIPQKEIGYGFFGDSHAADGINPVYIPEAYNFANPSENYIKNYYRLNKIVNGDGAKIDTIVFETDQHSFNSATNDDGGVRTDLYEYSTFIPMKDIAVFNDEPFAKVWFDSTFPSLGKGEETIDDIFYRFYNWNSTRIHNGYSGAVGDFSLLSETGRKQNAEITYELHFGTDKGLSGPYLDYFFKALNIAKEKKMHIIFVRYPVSKEYQMALSEHKKQRNSYYEDLTKKIDGALGSYPYITLDYYDLLSDHPEYFFDPDHLNLSGATILSKKLASDLKKIKESR